jgi:hypothetical protein
MNASDDGEPNSEVSDHAADHAYSYAYEGPERSLVTFRSNGIANEPVMDADHHYDMITKK